MPRNFASPQTKGRFDRDRIDEYLRDLNGVRPTPEQSGYIAAAVSSEWDWLRLEDQARHEIGKEKVETERRASECRRQYILARKQFYQTAKIRAADLDQVKPAPSLDQKIEKLRRGAIL